MTATPSAMHRRAAGRLERSIAGLSVGDAFGERFFATHPEQRLPRAVAGIDPDNLSSAKPWPWTDDTAMALCIADELEAHGTIDEGRLARRFADAYAREPWRGYGGTAHEILSDLGAGVPWQEAAARPWGGTGSKGNGGGMRAPPIGAFFADASFDTVVREATASALPTHRHIEGIAGAVAIAVATAAICRGDTDDAVWQATTSQVADSETRTRVEFASRLSPDTTPPLVADLLGSGQRVLAEDTVPYCIWCALRGRRANTQGFGYEAALFATVSGMGDMDTTCAIVGGMLAPIFDDDAIPLRWLAQREPLPARQEGGSR